MTIEHMPMNNDSRGDYLAGLWLCIVPSIATWLLLLWLYIQADMRYHELQDGAERTPRRHEASGQEQPGHDAPLFIQTGGRSMLVLGRREGEKVIITDEFTGEQITIVVAMTTAEKTRLGFQASDRFTIHRDEIQALNDAKAAP